MGQLEIKNSGGGTSQRPSLATRLNPLPPTLILLCSAPTPFVLCCMMLLNGRFACFWGELQHECEGPSARAGLNITCHGLTSHPALSAHPCLLSLPALHSSPFALPARACLAYSRQLLPCQRSLVSLSRTKNTPLAKKALKSRRILPITLAARQ